VFRPAHSLDNLCLVQMSIAVVYESVVHLLMPRLT